ncbi:hypothetical protein J1614_011412 [Plenodomus biglobosus]|nr:hypothetical protein J1614_011412 [Plenodomus biglobosus]
MPGCWKDLPGSCAQQDEDGESSTSTTREPTTQATFSTRCETTAVRKVDSNSEREPTGKT